MGYLISTHGLAEGWQVGHCVSVEKIFKKIT